MPDLEQDIAAFLTLDGHVFLAPQYDVAYNHELDEGGSCPDFVALDTGIDCASSPTYRQIGIQC